MPLSDNERDILKEIERQFYEEDPKLAQTVAETTVESARRRGQRVAVVSFIVGLVMMLAFFTISTPLAVAGFIVMLIAAGWITTNMRIGRSEIGVGTGFYGLSERLRQKRHRGG